MENTTTNIILIIQSTALGIYLFYKSYLEKKGENLAILEDIKEITHKIESVKDSFLSAHEKLKKELDLVFNVKLSLTNEERIAILEFHKAHTDWIDGGINSIYVSRYNSENFSELGKEIERINKLKSECSIKRGNIHLYTVDKKIIETSADLIIKSFELSDWLTLHLTSLHSELAYQKSCNIQFLELINKNQINERTKQLDSASIESKIKAEKITQEISTNIVKKNTPTTMSKVNFTHTVREYLKNKS